MNERITTAGIIIEDKRVLVAKRNSGKTTAGLWEFPGGKNRYGESEEETLKREFEEELSISIGVGAFITSFDFTNNETLYHLKAYLVYPESYEFKKSVHSEFAFVTATELLSLNMVPSDAHIRAIIASEYL